MLRTTLFLSVVVCLVAGSAARASAEEVLPAGTLLQCTLDEPNFSSRTAEIGDPVLCHVGAVAAFGRSVFPRGAYLAGRFQEYRDPGRLFGKGWIELAFDHMVLPDAVSLPVSAKVISVPHLKVSREGKIRGRGHAKRDALGWSIPVLWPVKVATLPARGPRPALKGETRIVLRLLEDVEIPASVLAARTTPSMPQNSRFRTSSGSAPFLQPFYEGSREPSEDPPVPQLTWLILKDGASYLVKDYWLEFGKLQFVTLDGERKLLPLARLALDRTVRLNQERNVQFAIRSRDSEP
jgi:hypothetical protein